MIKAILHGEMAADTAEPISTKRNLTEISRLSPHRGVSKTNDTGGKLRFCLGGCLIADEHQHHVIDISRVFLGPVSLDGAESA
jgi:hypothetical protein